MADSNELGMDMAQMAAAAKEFAGAEQAQAPVDVDLGEINPENEPAVEIADSDFWGDPIEAESDAADETVDEPAVDEEVSQEEPASSEGTLQYKANGKDIQLDLSNQEHLDYIAKLLPLAEGARKTFSDKNKLRQENRKLKEQAEESASYKSAWDKLEAIKHDHAQVFEAITGQSFDEAVQRKVDERSVYDQASPEDKRAMDYEARIAKMEAEQRRDREQRERELEESRSLKYATDKQSMNTQLKAEYAKYEFDSGNAATDNRLRKMLWQSALGDIADYKAQGYKLNEKVYAKAFRDNAKALQHMSKTSDAKTKEAARQEKKAAAKKAVAKAATQNYDLIDSNTTSLNPLDLFNKFRGR